MSCVACRVLRKGCSDKCPLRSSLSGIEGQEAQGYATVFLSKFFGRAGLTAFCSAVPEAQRPALFQSLLYEACGRTINPVYGSVGLLWSGKWHLCQAAVEKVLSGGQLGPADRAPLDSACAPLPSAKPGQAAGMLGPAKSEYGAAFSTGSRNGGSHSGASLSMFDGGLTGGVSLPMHPETMRLPLHSDSMRVSVHSDPMRGSREQTGISLSPPGSLSGLNPILMGLQYRDFAQSDSRFGAEVNLDPVVYQASPPLDLGGKLHTPNLGGFDSNRYGNGQHFNALRTMVPNRGFPL